MTGKPVCSVSLDLDNKWSYMKTHGNEEWKSFPSYLDLVVPRVLEFMKQRNQSITFFVVGQDAALEKNREVLAQIPAAGHEVGNHSFHHEPWLHLYSRNQVGDEIHQAEEAIEAATGIKPRGFRGPGYSLSVTTLQTLATNGYFFDATILSTFLGPLARAYYFRASDFTQEQKDQRSSLFGGLRDGLRPVKPFFWKLPEKRLLEIPVTTMPLIKLPFHFSYLLYISTFSVTLATLYFRAALRLCRLTGTEPSLLMHPLDFLGGDDVPELSFFPGMSIESARKVDLLDRFLQLLSSRYTIVSLGSHAERLRRTSSLKAYSPADLNL